MHCTPWSMRPTLKFFFWTILYKCYLQIKHRNQCAIQAMFSLIEGNTVDGGGVFCLLILSRSVTNLQAFKFISNWRIIALQYCIGFYQTSVWISYSVADSTSMCPILSEGKHWWNELLCIGTQSSTSTVVVTLHRKPPATGQRTRTQKDPPCPQWSQLSTVGTALATCCFCWCPAWLVHPTRQREGLGTFTASTGCAPSN